MTGDKGRKRRGGGRSKQNICAGCRSNRWHQVASSGGAAASPFLPPIPRLPPHLGHHLKKRPPPPRRHPSPAFMGHRWAAQDPAVTSEPTRHPADSRWHGSRWGQKLAEQLINIGEGGRWGAVPLRSSACPAKCRRLVGGGGMSLEEAPSPHHGPASLG